MRDCQLNVKLSRQEEREIEEAAHRSGEDPVPFARRVLLDVAKLTAGESDDD